MKFTLAGTLAFIIGAVGMSGAASAVADEALYAALKEGGKVVMIRHTDAEGDDPEKSLRLTSPKDCSQEANLTGTGREQAARITERLRAHGIEVAQVLSGEFCRTLQTAEVMFGSAEPWSALNLLNSIPQAEAAFVMEDVNDRIADFQGPGNLFMVTHRPNINTITFVQTEPGDMVVLQSDGTGGFEVLGKIAFK
jgi:phosphohistidine phosphatase SixA